MKVGDTEINWFYFRHINKFIEHRQYSNSLEGEKYMDIYTSSLQPLTLNTHNSVETIASTFSHSVQSTVLSR